MQNILVVDDDDSLRDTIGLMLEQEGFHVTLVEDGLKGYSEALRLRPDLILADLRMPGMTGVEVCRRLRDAGVKTPIIILSAVGDEFDKVLLLEIGADDYVVKPFGMRELLARIRAVLRRTSPDSNTVITFSDNAIDLKRLSLIHISEPTRRTPISYAVFC